MIRAALLLATTALSACVATAPRGVDVRHFASTEAAADGARWHIFLFEPGGARSLDERIALARSNVQSGCRWVGASRDEIAARTAAQGESYAGSVLAAPVRCRS